METKAVTVVPRAAVDGVMARVVALATVDGSIVNEATFDMDDWKLASPEYMALTT
jgi:hypothetical protein